MKTNEGILDNKELEQRAKFWSKKTFRTLSKKELDKSSNKMQKLLAAMVGFTKDEMRYIRSWKAYTEKGSPEHIIKTAWDRDFEYALSILPKVKQS